MTLKAFCQQNGLDPESHWYERAMAALPGRSAESVNHE
jgi:hypothetical protein